MICFWKLSIFGNLGRDVFCFINVLAAIYSGSEIVSIWFVANYLEILTPTIDDIWFFGRCYFHLFEFFWKDKEKYHFSNFLKLLLFSGTSGYSWDIQGSLYAQPRCALLLIRAVLLCFAIELFAGRANDNGSVPGTKLTELKVMYNIKCLNCHRTLELSEKVNRS